MENQECEVQHAGWAMEIDDVSVSAPQLLSKNRVKGNLPPVADTAH